MEEKNGNNTERKRTCLTNSKRPSNSLKRGLVSDRQLLFHIIISIIILYDMPM